LRTIKASPSILLFGSRVPDRRIVVISTDRIILSRHSQGSWNQLEPSQTHITTQIDNQTTKPQCFRSATRTNLRAAQSPSSDKDDGSITIYLVPPLRPQFTVVGARRQPRATIIIPSRIPRRNLSPDSDEEVPRFYTQTEHTFDHPIDLRVHQLRPFRGHNRRHRTGLCWRIPDLPLADLYLSELRECVLGLFIHRVCRRA